MNLTKEQLKLKIKMLIMQYPDRIDEMEIRSERVVEELAEKIALMVFEEMERPK